MAEVDERLAACDTTWEASFRLLRHDVRRACTSEETIWLHVGWSASARQDPDKREHTRADAARLIGLLREARAVIDYMDAEWRADPAWRPALAFYHEALGKVVLAFQALETTPRFRRDGVFVIPLPPETAADC